MKKYLLYSVALLCLNSCEENVKFNNPSFQGIKDNVFWRAVTTTASIKADGSLVVTAYTSDEQVVLSTNSIAIKTYVLGLDEVNTASYSQKNTTTNLSFATGTEKGSGQIVITEYDSANKTISGTFKFNALNTAADSSTETPLNFQEGVFYKVPVQL